MSSFIYFNSREASAETKYSAEVIKNALLKAETKSSAKADNLVKDIKQPVALNEALVFFTDKLGAIKQLSQSIIEVNEGRVKQFETDYADMEKSIKRGIGWIDPEYVATTWENSSDTIDFELVKDEIYNRLIKAGLLWYSDEDGEEKEFQVKSIKDLSESKEVQIYESATELLANEENFELYTATIKNKTVTVTATSTTKTWPDGIPVLKYLARGKSASTQIYISGSFDVAHDVVHGWFYFTDGRKWFGLHREDGYNEPSDLPFEMAIKESAITEAASIPYNIMDFAKRKGSYATSLVKKAATWAEKAGKRISGGTAIGKNYMTIILDMKHQGSEIYINLEDETIKLFDEEVTDAKSFQKVLDANMSESVVIEGISVTDERFYGKKGIIIMIDDNGKQVSAIFKDKKNADKYNRNKAEDIKALLDLAKDTKYPNAIDESVVDEGGAMSDIDLLAKESKDFKTFVKAFQKEYSNLDAGNFKELEAWLKSIYDAAKEDLDESVITEAKDSLLQDYVEIMSQKTFKGGGNGQNLLDNAMELAWHIDSYTLGRNTRGYEEDGFYEPVTIALFKKLVDSMSADDIKNNQDDKYESVVTEGKSINKIQKEWSETTTAMSQKVEQWKSAEGDRKIELLDELKALTAKKRALESELDAAVAGKDKDLELVVSEGNAFGAARAEAIAKGEKEFTVDGETYPVESVDDEDKTNAEEFVKESKSDLWSYLIEKYTINEDLRTDIKKYIKSNKKEIDAMADQDNWEGIYSMLMKDFEVREDDVKMADEIKTIFNIVY